MAPQSDYSSANVRLTEKQKKFVAGVVSGMGLAAAYRSAYSTQAGDKVVSVSANQLMRNPKIAAAVQTARAQLADQTTQESTQAQAKQFLLVQLMETCRNSKDEATRLKALELLAASMGIFIRQPVDLASAWRGAAVVGPEPTLAQPRNG